MTLSQTYSWILLAIGISSAKEAVDITEIGNIADYINRAIPSESEISDSLTWLVSMELVEKSGNKYQLTNRGMNIFNLAKGNGHELLKIWDRLNESISKMGVDNIIQINPIDSKPY